MEEREEMNMPSLDKDAGNGGQANPGDDSGQVAQAAIISEGNPEPADKADAEDDEQAEGPSGGDSQETEKENKKEGFWSGTLRKFRLPTPSILIAHRSSLLGVIIALLFVGLSAGIKWSTVTGVVSPPPVPVHVYLSTIAQELTDIFSFERFLIFTSEGKKAYLSVSISVKTPNEGIYYEIERHKVLYRSVIYEILGDSLRESDSLSTNMASLKLDIVNALNTKLRSGTVEEVLVTDLMRV